jgi:citrate lyase subunit beta/citryl-CoA lyase
MVRRSILFAPGDKPKLQRNAITTGADVVVFDLEDAIAPGQHDMARNAINRVLTDQKFDPDCEVCVRVNPGPKLSDDLDVVLDGDPRIDSLMLPKTEEASEIAKLDEQVTNRGYNLPIFALVESASGVLQAETIANANAADAICFGAEDFSADVGATRTEKGTEVLYARERVVAAAAAADIAAIDTLVTDFENNDHLRDDATFSAQLGFDGKMAIHPSQIEPINDAFTPDRERIQWAERVLEARDTTKAEEQGVYEVDGEMIDAPLIAQAERIMKQARAANLR